MSGGEPAATGRAACFMARVLPAALLLASAAVTAAAAVRPLMAFVEPPPRRLELKRDGRMVALQQVGPPAPLAQPWQVDSNGGVRVRGYRYRRMDGSPQAGGEVVVWLRSSASSARSSMAYGGVQRMQDPQGDSPSRCLEVPELMAAGFEPDGLPGANPQNMQNNQGKDGRNSLWKQLAWLTGSHPIRQKNCYLID